MPSPLASIATGVAQAVDEQYDAVARYQALMAKQQGRGAEGSGPSPLDAMHKASLLVKNMIDIESAAQTYEKVDLEIREKRRASLEAERWDYLNQPDEGTGVTPLAVAVDRINTLPMRYRDAVAQGDSAAIGTIQGEYLKLQPVLNTISANRGQDDPFYRAVASSYADMGQLLYPPMDPEKAQRTALFMADDVGGLRTAGMLSRSFAAAVDANDLGALAEVRRVAREVGDTRIEQAALGAIGALHQDRLNGPELRTLSVKDFTSAVLDYRSGDPLLSARAEALLATSVGGASALDAESMSRRFSEGGGGTLEQQLTRLAAELPKESQKMVTLGDLSAPMSEVVSAALYGPGTDVAFYNSLTENLKTTKNREIFVSLMRGRGVSDALTIPMLNALSSKRPIVSKGLLSRADIDKKLGELVGQGSAEAGRLSRAISTAQRLKRTDPDKAEQDLLDTYLAAQNYISSTVE